MKMLNNLAIRHSNKTILYMLLCLKYLSGGLQGTKQTKQTPWPLVRKRTIPTERPPLVDEI
jgi:hypothetical protein